MEPRTRSSMLGWVAAVMEMVSPSQLRPAVSQMTSMAEGAVAWVMGARPVVRGEGIMTEWGAQARGKRVEGALSEGAGAPGGPCGSRALGERGYGRASRMICR